MIDPPFTIEPVSFEQWDEAYLCRAGEVSLIVVASIGPRILSLRYRNNPELLYLDHSDFRVGDWRLIGGHRFDIAPESALSYQPDNGRCAVSVSEDSIEIDSPVAPNGLQKSLRIGPNEDLNGFRICHSIRNHSSIPHDLSPWAITCVNTDGHIVVPVPNMLDKSGVHFWNNGDSYQANPESDQWNFRKDKFFVKYKGEPGKVGLYSPGGQIAFVRGPEVFMISAMEIPKPFDCPHAGCNVEVYTGTGYMEMETLGALAPLLPGQTRRYWQNWELVGDRKL